MSDSVIVPKQHLVLIEQLGLPIAPIVCDFETREEAEAAARAWADAGRVEHRGHGMAPRSEPILQLVALKAPFRALVMSRTEHASQVRELQINQMRAHQAASLGNVPPTPIRR
jgi:hypothetical protein